MISLGVILLLILAVGLAFVVHRYFPGIAEQIIEWKSVLLRLGLVVLGVTFILLFLASNVWYLQILGILLAMIAALKLIHEDFSIRDWAGI